MANKRIRIIGLIVAVAAAAVIGYRLLPKNAPGLTAELPADHKPLIVAASNIDLAMKLLRTASDSGADGVYGLSPLTLVQNMAIIYGGTDGKTREQLSELFHIQGPAAEVIAAQNKIDNSLLERNAGHLEFAAAVMADETRATFRDSYRKLLAGSANLKLEAVDFSKAAEACATINDWVKKATHDCIDSIINPDDISKDTFSAFLTALYFSADWEQPFQQYPNAAFPFTSGGKTSDIPMQTRTGATPYYENDAWKYAELVCKDSPLVVSLVLPKARLTRAELVAALNGGEFTQMAMAAQPVEVGMRIPPFKMENTVDCKALMTTLGMTSWGNLEPMAESTVPLEIGAVRQKNLFDLNANGVKAASVTMTLIARMSLPLPPAREFHADRPFLWFLYDRESRTVLFAGWYDLEAE